ncbi:ABC transporter substrate-binding protein [Aquabacterium sp. A7-Y]|uniref:ABC transporter substrate-binding protein n=1 Tax=Aquabacterium sp. A7-Y TaxID=1349605 RepID=UPI00223E8294|nr:ABC transporter substrate-binding protein [Aquabacterium sp. A7-Y]MCW7536958.1 ABC transporter substrate-binding protein [Aquabacterium sp. A7-Y]
MDTDRRTVALLLTGAAYLALSTPARGRPPGVSSALSEQPWARWDDHDRPRRGGVFRTAAPRYIGMLNPNRWPVLDWNSLGYIHEKLLLTGEDYRPSIAWLAESLVAEDAKTTLITLRAGARFHDGTPMTADSLKQQLAWIQDADSQAWSRPMISALAAVEVVGPLQLRVRFSHPWAAFPGLMSTVPGYVLSSAALRADARKFETRQPAGTGPFLVDEVSPGNFLKLKRNPHWWFAKAVGRPDMPYFDGIHIAVIPEPGVRLANFRAGQLDGLSLDKSQYLLLKDDKRVAVFVTPSPNTAALRFNSARGPCSDLRVRQAVSHAIDRRALIAGTEYGLGRPASGLFPHEHWARNPKLQPVPFDPRRSRELLARAGFEKGLGLTGFLLNDTVSALRAEAIQRMLQQVGITWKVELLTPVAATARLEQGHWDLGPGGWSFIHDPDPVVTSLYHPSGALSAGRENNPALVRLIESARKELDPERRRRLYHELETLITEGCYDVWLWYEETAVAYHHYVKGYDHIAARKYKEVYLRSHPMWFVDGKPGRVA